MLLDIADLDVERPLYAFGIDSIMAVQLTSRIERDLGISVSVVDVLSDLSVIALARSIVTRLQPQDEHHGETAPVAGASPALDETSLTGTPR
jgi:acyl carrier protein